MRIWLNSVFSLLSKTDYSGGHKNESLNEKAMEIIGDAAITYPGYVIAGSFVAYGNRRLLIRWLVEMSNILIESGTHLCTRRLNLMTGQRGSRCPTNSKH
jgi:hypothetical protein